LIEIRLALTAGTLSASVPPLTPEQFYLAHDRQWTVLGNDLRLMMRWTGLDLDERAVFALMQFGTMIPPFTLSKRISRVPSGHVLRVSGSGDQAPPSVERARRSIIDVAQQGSKGHVADPEAKVSACMDDILSRVPPSGVLYFSGGVDSGLMAARLAAIGRSDVTLMHYSFGPSDPETALAADMAAYLRLRFELVPYDAQQLPLVLGRLAHDYSYPFDDYSTIPTNAMIHAMLQAHSQTPAAIEGSAADDSFSIGTRAQEWERMYSTPRLARRLVSDAHKGLRLWTHDTRLARYGRVARRSVRLPLLCAAIFARNALDGIAYHTPPATLAEIIDAIDRNTGALATGLSNEDRFSVLFMAHESCGLVAPKSFDPLRMYGVTPVYPYLDPALVQLSLSLTWEQKNEGGERKALLKKLLARQVPPDMVYRRKAGFAPPFQSLLALPSTQDYIHNIVLSPRNPLTAYFDTNLIANIAREARRGASQSIEVHFYLWALMFTSGWLSQLWSSTGAGQRVAASQPMVGR
jgi:asparagine synthetase B (glutamine-hydrolysing)